MGRGQAQEHTHTGEADHRRHAVCEDTIKDLKYGVGLNHLPSGRFAANAAWMVFNLIAHNLGRWTERIGLGRPAAPMTTKTFRTRLLDYIWAGLPMVVTRGDPLAELVDVQRLGIVVPPGDVTAWEYVGACSARQLSSRGKSTRCAMP